MAGNKKELFEKFSSEQEAELSFSMKYSWWNEVVQTSWDVAVVHNEGQVLGVWPYFLRKKGPWKMIAQAYLTPYAGPFLVYPEGQKSSSRISYENKLYEQLIEQLPEVAEIDLSFPLNFNNGLAFLWKGFNEGRKYTYLLELSPSEEELWGMLRENTRRQINKAKKTVEVLKELDARILDQMIQQSFESQTADYPFPEANYVSRVVNYLQKFNCGEVWIAKEGEEIHAALGIIYDNNAAYYLLGGSAQAFKNSGAMSLLMWEAILKAKEKGKLIFNFEGSTIPAIEKFIRGFGGELISFCRMSKKDSTALEILKRLKK